MQRYEKYKDSGIEWLGEIPEDWEVRRMANLGTFLKGKGIPRSELKENGCPAILYGDIYTKYSIKADFIFNHISEETAKNSIKIKFGDILFTGSGETREDIGKSITYVGNEPVCIGGDVIIFRQNEERSNSLFLSYSLNSNGSAYQKSRAGKGQIIVHIYSANLREIVLPYPSIDEQTAIANYLDRKTAEIDQLIVQKERLLGLYKEEKTAIINRAVTRGINPDVKLKDSGVEWLGEIPEGWEVKRLKYVVGINERVLPEKTENDFYIKYIDIGNVEFGKLKAAPQNILFSSAPSRARRVVRKGDTLISTVRTYLKAVLYIDSNEENLIASTGFAIMSPKNLFDSPFFFYMLSSEIILQNITATSVGVSYPAINATDIGFLTVWIPLVDEQTAIVQHIETETARINAKISKTEKIIILQKEYRTALISEAVTGKIKVTQEVA